MANNYLLPVALISSFLKKLVLKFVSPGRVSFLREPKWKLLDPPNVKERFARREKKKKKGGKRRKRKLMKFLAT